MSDAGDYPGNERRAVERETLAEIITRLERIEAGVLVNTRDVTELKEWRAEHQPWSESGRVLIEQSNQELKQMLEAQNRHNSPSAWRSTMVEVFQELLPTEMQTWEQRKQAVADQERGRSLREWKENNLTPARAVAGFTGLATLLASPQLILWTLNNWPF